MNSRATVPEVHTDTPVAIGELKVHNQWLGDLTALDRRACMQDAYLFLKPVHDCGAMARLRARFVDELERQWVLEPPGSSPTEQSARYNGWRLDDFPHRVEPLAEREPWRAVAAEPAIHNFFTRLLGVEPFWVPIAEYRATPSITNRQRERFDYVHEDLYSPGIDFRMLWFSLARIDSDVGGLVLAEGLTDKINLHRIVVATNKDIPLEAVPADPWRWTVYEAGDVLLTNLWTAHTGVTNLSDRFRLSLDIRILSKSDRCPIFGSILEISPTALMIQGEAGPVDLRIRPDTYARNHIGKKLPADGIVEFFSICATPIVPHTDDPVTVFRPPH